MADPVIVKETPKVIISEVKEVAINKVEPIPVSVDPLTVQEVIEAQKVKTGIQSGNPADINRKHG